MTPGVATPGFFCSRSASRAIRQIRHNRVNNQTNQSVSECARVGTKIAIVEVNNYFSHEETALRQIGAKSKPSNPVVEG